MDSMDSMVSKVSYLSGLAEGLEINKNSKEGKIIEGILDTLRQMAIEIDEMKEAHRNITEYVDAIDQDLVDLQDEFYGESYDEEYDLEEFIDVKCPNCSEIICVDKHIVEDKGKITCPSCNENISLNEDCNICDCNKED